MQTPKINNWGLNAQLVVSHRFEPQDCGADTQQVRCEGGDVETGSEWRGGTCGRSLPASCHVWSRQRARSVAKWLELKCFFSAIRRTPPEINTHLSSAGKQAAADVCNMKVHICVCMCVYMCVCPSHCPVHLRKVSFDNNTTGGGSWFSNFWQQQQLLLLLFQIYLLVHVGCLSCCCRFAAWRNL